MLYCNIIWSSYRCWTKVAWGTPNLIIASTDLWLWSLQCGPSLPIEMWTNIPHNNKAHNKQCQHLSISLISQSASWEQFLWYNKYNSHSVAVWLDWKALEYFFFFFEVNKIIFQIPMQVISGWIFHVFLVHMWVLSGIIKSKCTWLPDLWMTGNLSECNTTFQD